MSNCLEVLCVVERESVFVLVEKLLLLHAQHERGADAA